MASRGQAVTLSYYAYDTGASAPRPGDVANHTIRIAKDGGPPAAPTNAAAEVDATNMKGWYQVALTAAESTCNTLLLAGVSSTAGVVIWGTTVTFEQLPTAAPGASGGLPLGDASGRVLLEPVQSFNNTGQTAKLPATVATGDGADAASVKGTLGAAGAGLTALGDARIAHLDADISTRLSSLGVAAPDGWITGTVLAASAVAAIQAGLATEAVLDSYADHVATAAGANSITLDASDPAMGTTQVGNRIFLTGGTAGVGQYGIVTASSTSTGVQTIGAGWSAGVTPTGTVTYEIFPPAASGGGGGTNQTGDVFALVNPLVSGGALTSTALANVPKTGYSLSSSGLDAIRGFNGWSFPRAIRALIAVVIGKRSGVPASGTGGTITFTESTTGDYGTLTVDTNGNITAVGMTPVA